MGARSAIQGIEIEAAGERIVLTAHRAAWWPAERTLFIADVHLGKGETMSAHGVPMPAGLLDRELARVRDLIDAFGAEELVVLGDLLHAPIGLTSGLIAHVREWRGSVAARISIIPGNHDRRLEEVAAAWGLEVWPPVVAMGPFSLSHAPTLNTPGFAWCGHVHPGVTVRLGVGSERFPCYRIGPNRGVLPAFGVLTGCGGRWDDGYGMRTFAIAEGAVIELPGVVRSPRG